MNDFSKNGFPEWLNELRMERGWTVEDLAERSGLSSRTIRLLEGKQRAHPNERTLFLLAKAFGMTVPQFLEFPGPDGSGAVLTDEGSADGGSVEGGAVALDVGGDPALDREGPAPHPGTESAPDHDPGSAMQAVPATPLPTARHRRRRRGPIAAVVAAALLALVALAIGIVGVDLSVEGGRLVARNRLTQRVSWRLDVPAPVEFFEPSPYGGDRVLVGLSARGTDGGRILHLDRRTGGVLWDRAPDPRRQEAAFGYEMLHDGTGFIGASVHPVDLDGDGVPELAALYVHGRYAPTSLLFLDRDGGVLGQYDHYGHLYGFLAADLDADGKQELVAAGTNNHACYQGATLILFDDAHCNGASFDTIAGGSPDVPDSSLVRLVLPSFGKPYMELLGALRIEATNPTCSLDPEGATRIACGAGTGGVDVEVTVDGMLRPLHAEPSDVMLVTCGRWPDAARDAGGPCDEAWLRGWLARAARFECGDWPP